MIKANLTISLRLKPYEALFHFLTSSPTVPIMMSLTVPNSVTFICQRQG